MNSRTPWTPWTQWATIALAAMDSAWERTSGLDSAAIAATRESLQQVASTGLEPYWTLKSFVHHHGLLRTGEP